MPKQAITDAVALANDVRAGRRDAGEVVAGAIEAARERAELGAFWALAEQRAMERAAEVAEADLPLAGVPLAVKDSFDLAGLPTMGGIQGQRPPAGSDAVAVQLLEAAGAIAIGKTAMDPLAWTTHGQADGFPPCLNPVDPALSPGGSSSGSAVAVAAGIVPLALGSDTGGSIRIPASYCGVVGLKPAFGAIPLDGCLPLSSSTDTVGVLATSVRDCAAAYDALVGRPHAAVGEAPTDEPVGVLTDLFGASAPEVKDVCGQAVHRLEQSGARVEEVTLGWWAPRLGLLYAVEFEAAWGAEADADPSRFTADMLATFERARAIPKQRYDEFRAEIATARDELGRRLRRFSALISPTVPVPVPSMEEEDVATSTRFTRIFNALGWPALSVPCGRDQWGAPVGLHIASAKDIDDALRVALLVERLTLRTAA